MNFSFQEKSAWGLLVGLAIVSFYYFPAAFEIVEAGEGARSLIGLLIGGVIVLVLIEIAYHTLIAVVSPKQADESDERDKLIDLKAERNAGFVLGFALITLVGFIVLQSEIQAYRVPSPLGIAVWIMLAITVSEISKLASQIWYYRIGV